MNDCSDYYATTAYHPGNIPDLPGQDEVLNRSKLKLSASVRLPWGHTREVAPVIMLHRMPPRIIRKYESKSDPAQKAGFAEAMNHERIRFEKAIWPTHLIALITVLGKVGFVTLGLIALAMSLIDSYGQVSSFIEQIYIDKEFIAYFVGIPLALWVFGSATLKLFGRALLKPGKGPEWELNRRKGLVKIWNYPSKKPFRKRGKPTIEEIPFVEFDAYILASLGPYGTNYFFEFLHRYRKLSVPIGYQFLGNQISSYPVFAFWDFIQNFMDISRPLPDIPAFEEFRHLDPVTAKHDRRTGRPERYWRDMDNKTFHKKCVDMIQEVARGDDAISRPNIMEKKVRYVSY